MDGGLEGWARDYVMFEARAIASAMGFPDQFVNGIKIRRAGRLKVQLYNSWWGENYHTGARDVPLARFWERGTRRHFVKPVYARALSWTVTFGGKSFPQFSKVTGQRTVRFFSKGHYVSGIGGGEPMRAGFERGMRRLKGRLAREVDTWRRLQEAGLNA